MVFISFEVWYVVNICFVLFLTKYTLALCYILKYSNLFTYDEVHANLCKIFIRLGHP